jgi:hypothetical protein
MKRFNVRVYVSEPRTGPHPHSERIMVAGSASEASKIAIDELAEFPWRVIDVIELRSAVE